MQSPHTTKDVRERPGLGSVATTIAHPPPSEQIDTGTKRHRKEKPRNRQALTSYGAETSKCRLSSRLQPFVQSPYITCDIWERPGRRSIRITIAHSPPSAQHAGNETRVILTVSAHIHHAVNNDYARYIMP